MPKILVEGRPGSGKSTLAVAVAEELRSRGLTVAGFVTEEIRHGGRRVGFSIEAFGGERGVLAHIDPAGKPRVGRYRVDVETFERVAIRALGEPGAVVVIDELGKMELLSAEFRSAVTEIFDGGRDVMATVHVFRHPFTDALKARSDVKVVILDRARRDGMVADVVRMLA
jgi:nucleoside-triphosphatase